MKTIAKIEAKSLGKTMGAIYGAMGLIFGGIIALITALGSTFTAEGGGNLSILFGVGAIIILPIMYGLLGYLFGLLAAWLYNLSVRFTGGIKLDIQDTAIETENKYK